MEFDVLYNENAKAEEVVAAIRRTLIQRLGKEDFTITTQQQMLDVLGSVLNMLTAAVGARRHFTAGRLRWHSDGYDYCRP